MTCRPVREGSGVWFEYLPGKLMKWEAVCGVQVGINVWGIWSVINVRGLANYILEGVSIVRHRKRARQRGRTRVDSQISTAVEKASDVAAARVGAARDDGGEGERRRGGQLAVQTERRKAVGVMSAEKGAKMDGNMRR